MISRKFSFRSLVRRLCCKRPATASTPTSPVKTTAARDRVRSGIEPLEGRIAPAMLLDARTLVYFDPDGDRITVAFSRDVFDLDPSHSVSLAADLRNVFKFTAGFAHVGGPDVNGDVPQQLQLIDLGQVSPATVNGAFVSRVAGTSLTITAEKQIVNSNLVGDDFAAIGAIKGGGNSLKNVFVDGDLGQIDCGAGNSKIGLKSLRVQSIGKFGTSTQIQVAMPDATHPAPDLESRINGRVKLIKVAEDMGGYIHVVDATTFSNNVTNITQRATIDNIVIRGSLMGNATVAATSDNTGHVDAYDIGKVKIGTTVADGIFGGGGANSGAVTAGNSIRSVTVTGDIVGGAKDNAGSIFSVGTLGPVSVGGDLNGGDGLRSGVIRSGGRMGSVAIGSDVAGGDVKGGVGDTSGVILSGGGLGKVRIFGDITGVGPHSGGVFSGGNIKGVTVAGSVTGGTNLASGAIEALGTLGPVSIGGDLTGGNGAASGSVISGASLESITIGGKLDGGAGPNSGAILAGNDPSKAGRNLGSVTIGGAMLGDNGSSSGAIVAGGAIGTVHVGSAVPIGTSAIQGGAGPLSGAIYAGGAIGMVNVVRGIAGATGPGSASIQAHGKIGRVDVGGDVVGGVGEESASILAHEILHSGKPVAGDIRKIFITGNLGGAGVRSALIEAAGGVGQVSLGAISGGSGSYSGAIVSGTGLLPVGDTELILVAGAITGGTGDHSGYVEIGARLGSFTAGSMDTAVLRVGDQLGAFSVNGNIVDSLITARGQAQPGATKDVAIGSINVVGSVTGSRILAGYDVIGTAVNGDASVGRVTVGHDWIASTLAVGIRAGDDGLFGTSDDKLISGNNRAEVVAKIARIVVGGSVEGSAADMDHFGFIAQKIAGFSSGGTALALTGTPGEVFELGTHSDLSVREVLPA